MWPPLIGTIKITIDNRSHPSDRYFGDVSPSLVPGFSSGFGPQTRRGALSAPTNEVTLRTADRICGRMQALAWGREHRVEGTVVHSRARPAGLDRVRTRS